MACTGRGTGCFSHKTHTVDGCGIAARAFDRRIYILRNFVHAAEDNDIFRSETERGKAVADAINIYQHTVFGNGVDAGKEEICQKPLVMQFPLLDLLTWLSAPQGSRPTKHAPTRDLGCYPQGHLSLDTKSWYPSSPTRPVYS